MAQECDLFFRVAPATAIAGSTTDFFTAKGISVGSRVITLSVSLDTATKLYARLNGTNCVMNADANLAANALYTFSFVMSGADTLTFRAGAACVVNYMVITTGME